jgi:hypothetical protein
MTGDWNGFHFDSILAEAMEMHDHHRQYGVRTSASMRQDALEYWIAVVAWQRAKDHYKTPMGSTRWRERGD